MQTIRQIALGVCLLCAAAGMIRIFWPDNHFKPVINTVLLLYILTSVLQTGAGADWDAVAGDILAFDCSQPSPADLSSYQEQLGLEVSVQALKTLFAQNGIEGEFRLENGTLYVTLQDPEDLRTAQDLLNANCGDLPFVLNTEGGN